MWRCHRFAIQIEGQRLWAINLNPRQLRADGHALKRGCLAIGHQSADRARHFAGEFGHHGQVQQAVVDERFRAQHLAATGLPAIAQAQCDEVALPLELRVTQACLQGLDAASLEMPVMR